jgi:hypothetical protein
MERVRGCPRLTKENLRRLHIDLLRAAGWQGCNEDEDAAGLEKGRPIAGCKSSCLWSAKHGVGLSSSFFLCFLCSIIFFLICDFLSFLLPVDWILLLAAAAAWPVKLGVNDTGQAWGEWPAQAITKENQQL